MIIPERASMLTRGATCSCGRQAHAALVIFDSALARTDLLPSLLRDLDKVAQDKADSCQHDVKNGIFT